MAGLKRQRLVRSMRSPFRLFCSNFVSNIVTAYGCHGDNDCIDKAQEDDRRVDVAGEHGGKDQQHRGNKIRP